ncbi:MAG: NADPH:quinone oxidoreductase family protein [Acidimicrobiia bacterium]|jgi:NADPH2:quinone reductase|nr:NADPH:quinone oxidoreductase family protein [Acidimicrobiia bacterium]
MRAWQVRHHGEPRDALVAVEVTPPVPEAGEVRIRVSAAALALPDVLMCRGTYALTPAPPFTPGQEVAGVVSAVGPGVGVEIGSRVMAVTAFYRGHGGFADEALAGAVNTYPAPPSMSDRDAAAFHIAFQTAWIGLMRRGRLQPGDHLLVLGAAGGTGAAAVQLGRALGARVIAVAAGVEKVEYCRGLGAHVVIDRLVDGVPETVAEATGGHGVDLVYDPVGGSAGTEALRCVANGGGLLAVGFASGEWPDLAVRDLVTRNCSIMGVFAGAYTRDEHDEMHRELLALVDGGDVSVPVHRTVDFDDIPAALEELAQARTLGRTVALVSAASHDERAARR